MLMNSTNVEVFLLLEDQYLCAFVAYHCDLSALWIVFSNMNTSCHISLNQNCIKWCRHYIVNLAIRLIITLYLYLSTKLIVGSYGWMDMPVETLYMDSLPSQHVTVLGHMRAYHQRRGNHVTMTRGRNVFTVTVRC